MIKETFGGLIKRKRLERKFSISQMSEFLGLVENYIRAVENNSRGAFRSIFVCDILIKKLKLNKIEIENFWILHKKYRKQRMY